MLSDTIKYGRHHRSILHFCVQIFNLGEWLLLVEQIYRTMKIGGENRIRANGKKIVEVPAKILIFAGTFVFIR
ncbi:hypothetical protein ALO_16936 [Acetonema longum DSM 6540]|uniref:Uncharacterized protein n=1 Tax=Acetonema longum DSM 6540 TaxID=1009370 RepID=F7NMQ6_9FIRM|nr:hypothetical protein ALO_16936 [Acetonema longum DSM 6540]